MKKLTTQEFIKRAQNNHPDNDYFDTEYINKRTEVAYTCPFHGQVYQLPMNHLRIGCGYCSRKRDNTYSFIKKSQWDNDYTVTIYKNNKTKITYICPTHGIQEQLPLDHLKYGCRRCSNKRTCISKHTPETVLERATEAHNGVYVYPNLIFDTIHDKTTIICPKHGKFEQQIAAHINKSSPQGCPVCGLANRKNPNKIDTERFIERAISKYGNACDYSDVNLDVINTHDYIDITCNLHGRFTTTAHLHLNQCIYPCPQCARESSTSEVENRLYEFVRDNYDGEILRNNREILNGREIDIYLPALKFGIEYHGLYYHTESKVGKKHHSTKANLAESMGVYLLQIFEHELGDIFNSIIKNILGKSRRIFGRKTELVNLTSSDKDKFLATNHMQGSDKSSVHLGLLHEGELVSCMTFGKPRFNSGYDWEIIRFCNKLGINILGGANKLFNHFREHYTGSVISYANRRLFSGKMYLKLGMKRVSQSAAGYFYYHPQHGILNRLSCQKHKLKGFKNYAPEKTAHMIMQELGYDRVWDAGQNVYAIGR